MTTLLDNWLDDLQLRTDQIALRLTTLAAQVETLEHMPEETHRTARAGTEGSGAVCTSSRALAGLRRA